MPNKIPDRPFISVLMTVYNGERFVAEATRSILAQTYDHFEFIICDDGSTDGTRDVLEQLARCDARIRLLYLEHGGVAHALNIAIDEARGDLVTPMDADDIALPERFAAQLAWMQRKNVDICGALMSTFGNQTGLWWVPESHEAIRHELLFRIALFHPTVLMSAEILRTHRYNELAVHSDYELWTRLVRHYRMGNLQQVLLKHRRHPNQLAQASTSEMRSDLRTYRRPYFFALFPEASDEDYAALAAVAEKRPLQTLDGLERAGRWLARLAQTPDITLRQFMARRWVATCQRSAHHGFATYRLYEQIAAEFDLAADGGTPLLWSCCLLHLRAGSAPHVLLSRLNGLIAARRNRRVAAR